jgi:PAS domain S-box-containing protein
LHDFIVSQEGQSLEEMLNDCKAESCTGEFSLKTADGAGVPVSLSANLLTLNDTETFCVVTANLTEQKRIQAMLEGSRDILEKRVEQRTAELQASRDQLQNIIDNMTAIVYVFDLEERFLLGNISLARLFQTTPENMIGKRRHEFVPKETADRHEANDRKAIETCHAVEFEEYGPLKDGHPITWLTTKFPLRDSQDNIYALAGISVDISERKKASD